MTRNPRGQRRCGRCWSFLAAVLGVLLIVHAVWNYLEGRRLSRTIRAQTAEGLPMSLTAVLPPSIPDQRNAAVPLARAFSVMGGKPPAHEGTPEALRRLLYYRFDEVDATTEGVRLVANLSPDEREALAARLREPDAAAVLQLLTVAAEGLPAQFPVDYEQGVITLLPHLRPLRTAHHLLCLRAWLASESGDVSAALRDLRTALQLTRGLSREPLMISHQNRITCDRQVLRILHDLLNRHALDVYDQPQLWALVGSLTEAREAGLQGLVRALDGERVIFGGWLFLSLLSGERRDGRLAELNGSGWMRWYRTYLCRPLLKADARAYLIRMEAYRRAAASGNVRALQTLTDNPLPRRYPLTHTIEPAVAALWQSAVQWLAELQLADLSVRLVLHARLRGGFPASLSALEHTRDGILLDPLGQPVNYTRTADGFRLYSYGLDGVDQDRIPESLLWELRTTGE